MDRAGERGRVVHCAPPFSSKYRSPRQGIHAARTLSHPNAVVRLNNVEVREMFSLNTKIVALPGTRDTLVDILLKGSRNMPGCLKYIIAKDPRDESSVWINELWRSEASHRSALSLRQMREATSAALPMIAGVGEGIDVSDK